MIFRYTIELIHCQTLECKNHLKLSWNNTENTSPNARFSCRGTTAYQSTDDSSNEISQKKALAISMIILMGSAAMVNVNIASGGPKAKKAQPKKSITVIFFFFFFMVATPSCEYFCQ